MLLYSWTCRTEGFITTPRGNISPTTTASSPCRHSQHQCKSNSLPLPLPTIEHALHGGNSFTPHRSREGFVSLTWRLPRCFLPWVFLLLPLFLGTAPLCFRLHPHPHYNFSCGQSIVGLSCTVRCAEWSTFSALIDSKEFEAVKSVFDCCIRQVLSTGHGGRCVSAGGSRPEIGRLTLRIVAHRLVVSGITVGADLSEELPLYYAGGWSRHGEV